VHRPVQVALHQGSHNSGFVDKPHPHLAAKNKLARQQLNSHMPLQVGVMGQKNNGQAPVAEDFFNLVTADLLGNLHLKAIKVGI
jgi:hypothetical protein